MPNDTKPPAPSPLEGVEIPSYVALEDWMIPESLAWVRHSDLSRTRTMAALLELAERRLAEHDTITLTREEREELAHIVERDRYHMLNCEALMESQGHEAVANCMRDAADRSESWSRRLREGK